jgi:carbamate kinase
MRIVIALGGNALSSPDGRARVEDQQVAVAQAAEPIADLVVAGHQVLITHGNGPQVGNLLVKNELAAHEVAPIPLDWCGAQTQATIGFTVMNALDGALARRGSTVGTATLVSRTRVDAGDPGFEHPTKPIGRFMDGEEAAVLQSHGQHFAEVVGRGWRRVVPSPKPIDCVDAPAADALLAAGFVVVCSGGGGIPVVEEVDRSWRGVEAVVDKDLTAAVIAEHLEADLLVIATDVPEVVTGWGTLQEHPLGEVTVSEMKAIAAREAFPAGSMGPKVAAVVEYVERVGGTGVITSLARLRDAVAGEAGTRVVPDAARASGH